MNQLAPRGDNVNPYYASDMDRVIAFHRWLEGTGQDVIVIASFGESTWWNYQLGFPVGGFWKEVFNSNVYDHWVNPGSQAMAPAFGQTGRRYTASLRRPRW